jgi:hypothetical protein
MAAHQLDRIESAADLAGPQGRRQTTLATPRLLRQPRRTSRPADWRLAPLRPPPVASGVRPGGSACHRVVLRRGQLGQERRERHGVSSRRNRRSRTGTVLGGSGSSQQANGRIQVNFGPRVWCPPRALSSSSPQRSSRSTAGGSYLWWAPALAGMTGMAPRCGRLCPRQLPRRVGEIAAVENGLASMTSVGGPGDGCLLQPRSISCMKPEPPVTRVRRWVVVMCSLRWSVTVRCFPIGACGLSITPIATTKTDPESLRSWGGRTGTHTLRGFARHRTDAGGAGHWWLRAASISMPIGWLPAYSWVD